MHNQFPPFTGSFLSPHRTQSLTLGNLTRSITSTGSWCSHIQSITTNHRPLNQNYTLYNSTKLSSFLGVYNLMLYDAIFIWFSKQHHISEIYTRHHFKWLSPIGNIWGTISDTAHVSSLDESVLERISWMNDSMNSLLSPPSNATM